MPRTYARPRTTSASNPNVVSQYCNGSRIPPEIGGLGYQVPPGISDATVPNPIFNLTPAATVDEGNNWINISWGPLALTNPVRGRCSATMARQPAHRSSTSFPPRTGFTANFAAAPSPGLLRKSTEDQQRR